MGKTVSFADLTDTQRTYLECSQIDGYIVTGKQAQEIASVLELQGKTIGELTSLRNAVVQYLSGLAGIARYCENRKSYDRYHNAMSGITAVIDSYIYT